MARYFSNSPMLVTEADAVRFFDGRSPLAVRGFIGPDDTRRMLIEITPDAAAEEIAAQARRIEKQARALRAFAEGWQK